MKPDAFWLRVSIHPHTSDSSRKPEELPNGTVFRILPANGTPHAWRHSLQSIRERSYRLRNYIFPFIGTTPIARLEVQDIMAVLRPLEMKRCYETSRRVLQIINQVFRYAVITGRARHNIAADLRGALRPRRVTHRAAVLTPEKVGQLLRDIDAYDGYFPLVCALKLAPLVFLPAPRNYGPRSGASLILRLRNGAFRPSA